MIQADFINPTFEIYWYEDNQLISGAAVNASLTLKHGSTTIVENQPAFVGSPDFTAQLTLGAGLFAGLPYSDNMLEIWSLNHPDYELHFVRRSGHFVRNVLYPMVTDADLISRHARIEDIRPPNLTNFTSYIDTAWSIINRDLIKRGRRPELVLDSYALVDMHIYKSLELIFKDASTFVGDGRYHELMTMYAAAYRDEWDIVQFHYDREEIGTMNDAQREAASPSIWLGEPPPNFLPSVVLGLDD